MKDLAKYVEAVSDWSRKNELLAFVRTDTPKPHTQILFQDCIGAYNAEAEAFPRVYFNKKAGTEGESIEDYRQRVFKSLSRACMVARKERMLSPTRAGKAA